MNNPNKNSLIVPDVHQNHEFLAAAIRVGKEREVEEFILLGDLVDWKDPAYAGSEHFEETIYLVRRLLKGNIPTTVLMGNHDAGYIFFSDRFHLITGPYASPDSFFESTGLDKQTTYSLMHSGNWAETVGEMRYAIARAGYLITHAGVHSGLIPAEIEDPETAANHLELSCRGDFAQMMKSPYLGAGTCRGGKLDKGGILWLDFEQEFVDDLRFPQICGHTIGCTARQAGRSWCLDANQTQVGILHGDGRLEALDIAQKKAKGVQR